MKLLVITCLKEYQTVVMSIIEEVQINVFSVTNTIGHKKYTNVDLLDNWFASGEDRFDSIIFFCFAEDNKADNALKALNNHNENLALEFPIRAFILPVEQSNY